LTSSETELISVAVSVSSEALPLRTTVPEPPRVIPVAVPPPLVAAKPPENVVVLLTSRRSSPLVDVPRKKEDWPWRIF